MPLASQNSWGIFSVDPGCTTGVATALVDLSQGTVAGCMRRAHRKGLVKTHEIKGDWFEQGWELARGYFDWMFKVHIERGLLVAGHCLYVTEGFEIRTMAAEVISLEIKVAAEMLIRTGFGDRTVPTPSKVVHSDEFDRVYSVQMPSEKTFCSNTMLKDWKLFKKSPHENDALRHIARRVDKLLKGEEDGHYGRARTSAVGAKR